ncbi:carboxylic ester hydrolase [Halobacillus andaensis]|uniref:Carboxylic ester hydrolase n=1 Tax=Halobacillus andaensis TaxID=1176239 RepID=A0A917B7H6_HALAA|nr:prolyl oligopeptidase family serine peptidase [Halobacillus andaensis]MBP2006522.1 putative dienelactone hydrolase [Halobacillus andaensis]GGF28015.1 carboxylic ester hydrolase [Halobacillus andaensis]
MRALEIILLIVQLVWFLSLLYKPLRKWKTLVFIITIIILGAHLLLEGFRTQMLLAYLAEVFILIGWIRRKLKDRESHAMGKWKLSCLVVVVILYIGITVTLSSLLPVFTLPTPTGEYQVGMKSEMLVDKERIEGGQPRELMVSVWYPAISSESQDNTYLSYPYEEVAGALSVNFFGLPSLVFDHLKQVKTNTLNEAELLPKEDGYPVVLFSHGFMGTRMQNYSQMEELASQGYIVVSLDHTYESAYTRFPDGREVKTKYKATDFSGMDHSKNIATRTADASFVLDKLQEWNEKSESSFQNTLDLSRVGMFGHSYGGATTAKVMAEDFRFKVGANMDGALYGSDVEEGFTQPFMNLIAKSSYEYTPSEEELKMNGMTLEEYKALSEQNLQNINTLFQSGVKDDSYKITFLEGDHYSFSDMPYWVPILENGYDKTQNHPVMNKYIVALFDQYLKGENQQILQEEKEDPIYTVEAELK